MLCNPALTQGWPTRRRPCATASVLHHPNTRSRVPLMQVLLSPLQGRRGSANLLAAELPNMPSGTIIHKRFRQRAGRVCDAVSLQMAQCHGQRSSSIVTKRNPPLQTDVMGRRSHQFHLAGSIGSKMRWSGKSPP